MATSRWSDLSYVCVNFWLKKFDRLVQTQGKAEPKIGMVNPPLALSFYFWQFCTGEWWIYWRLGQKNLEKCYRWDFFILDPKKSKKARKCDKILLYYWVHSYEFELERQPMWTIGSGMNQKTSWLLFWVWTRILHSSSFVKYCANVFVQLINDAENPKWPLFILIIVQKQSAIRDEGSFARTLSV